MLQSPLRVLVFYDLLQSLSPVLLLYGGAGAAVTGGWSFAIWRRTCYLIQDRSPTSMGETLEMTLRAQVMGVVI